MLGFSAKLHTQPADAQTFRQAMRQLAGGVSIVTVGKGDAVSGFTSTSVASLSADPAELIFCVSRSSSSWPLIAKWRVFAVNVLTPDQQHLADRFAGRNGEKGADRYSGGVWTTLITGAPILSTAMAALDCEVVDIIERNSSAIVVGRVAALEVTSEAAVRSVLTYWRGAYVAISQ